MSAFHRLASYLAAAGAGYTLAVNDILMTGLWLVAVVFNHYAAERFRRCP